MLVPHVARSVPGDITAPERWAWSSAGVLQLAMATTGIGPAALPCSSPRIGAVTVMGWGLTASQCPASGLGDLEGPGETGWWKVERPSPSHMAGGFKEYEGQQGSTLLTTCPTQAGDSSLPGRPTVKCYPNVLPPLSALAVPPIISFLFRAAPRVTAPGGDRQGTTSGDRGTRGQGTAVGTRRGGHGRAAPLTETAAGVGAAGGGHGVAGAAPSRTGLQVSRPSLALSPT